MDKIKCGITGSRGDKRMGQPQDLPHPHPRRRLAKTHMHKLHSTPGEHTEVPRGRGEAQIVGLGARVWAYFSTAPGGRRHWSRAAKAVQGEFEDAFVAGEPSMGQSREAGNEGLGGEEQTVAFVGICEG